MKRSTRKALGILLSLVLTLSLVPATGGTASAEPAAAAENSGVFPGAGSSVSQGAVILFAVRTDPSVHAENVTLDKTAEQTIATGESVVFRADVEGKSTDKAVRWSVEGESVKLYADEACRIPVGTGVTDKLTVYAKGVAPGSSTVGVTGSTGTVTSASCLVTVYHAHSFSYAADGASITASCVNAGCDLPDGKVTLTLSAPDDIYTGRPYTGASLDSEAWEAAGLAVPSVYYLGRNDSDYFSDVPPTEIGAYTAATGRGTGALAAVDFSITTGVRFEGGGLRRRVVSGTDKVVNDETDLRLVFSYALPEGAEIVTDEDAGDYSYFLWSTGDKEPERKLTASFFDTEKRQCSLVLTRVTDEYFGLDVNARLHLVYTLDGETCTVDSPVGSRSVDTICDGLKGKDSTWGQYAQYLLVRAGSYKIE